MAALRRGASRLGRPSQCHAVVAPSQSDPLTLDLRRQLDAMPADRRRALRCLQPGGEPATLQEGRGIDLVDLASNDYLGLSHHPRLMEAASRAMALEGLGSGGSRLISGTRPCHQHLETHLAQWLGRDRVLLFPSGFQANLAAVTALTGRHGLALVDRLAHHSLLVGVRCSGARLQRFAHNDLNDLERRLKAFSRSRLSGAGPPPLVISESLFSMEGTSSDVARLAALCADHGARLLVDEAHALGVLGDGGRGPCHGIREPVTLISGTFGKAFGGGGAFLAGDAVMGDWLLQTSAPFRYTTALAPPLAAAALEALNLIESNPEWGASLCERAECWRHALVAAGWPRPSGHGPILPLIVGGAGQALRLQAALEQEGLLSVAIRPPTVPVGRSRLRLVLRRDCPQSALETLVRVLGEERPRLDVEEGEPWAIHPHQQP